MFPFTITPSKTQKLGSLNQLNIFLTALSFRSSWMSPLCDFFFFFVLFEIQKFYSINVYFYIKLCICDSLVLYMRIHCHLICVHYLFPCGSFQILVPWKFLIKYTQHYCSTGLVERSLQSYEWSYTKQKCDQKIHWVTD